MDVNPGLLGESPVLFDPSNPNLPLYADFRSFILLSTVVSLNTTSSYSAAVKLLLCPVRSIQTLRGVFCVVSERH